VTENSKKVYRKYDSVTDTLNYAFHYNDEETEDLHRLVNNNTQIGIDDLRRIALWKINRVLRVSDETIEKLRHLAGQEDLKIDDERVREVIDELVSSDGIGFPMASAFLKFLRPDVFPIIDVRAYRAFTGLKPYYSTYDYQKYKSYTQELHRDAKNKDRPLKEMDEQLYCFDKDVNGKI